MAALAHATEPGPWGPRTHCYAANAGAIALYEKLGFRTRARMCFTILALE